MRILLTSDFFHPVIGGAERQVQLLAAELARRGNDVRVATTAQPGMPGTDVVDGVTVTRLGSLATAVPWFSGDPSRRFVPPAPDPRLVIGLRRLLAAWPAEVVHASGWIAYASAAAVLGRPVPLVLSVRDYGYACAVRNLLWHDRVVCDGPAPAKCLDCAGRHYGAVRGLAAVVGVFSGRPLLRRTVTGIHSVSRFVESTVRRDVLRGDTGWQPIVERIADIVPLRDPATGSENLPAVLTGQHADLARRLPDEPFILFVGALVRPKGLAVLLDAWGRLGERGAGRPPLVLIGTRWPETPASFPPGVTVLSDVPHPVVMHAWERCLFGVAPSIWPDPLPGVVREPMTRARPVIATAIGGNLDMVMDNETGLLVPPGDAPALAVAMARLLDDPDLRGRMGRAGRASVAALTPAAIASSFESLYRRAAAIRAQR